MTKRIEDLNQEAFFSWLKASLPEVDAVSWHTPNGGSRNIREATALKARGVKPGVPDIFIAIRVKQHAGLFIELKAKTKPTLLQLQMMERLELNGYKVAVCYNWESARDTVLDYLKGTEYVQRRAIKASNSAAGFAGLKSVESRG